MTGIILMIACKCIDEIKSFFFVYQTRMEETGILAFLKEKVSLKELLGVTVKEWLKDETGYLGFSTDHSFRDEAEQ